MSLALLPLTVLLGCIALIIFLAILYQAAIEAVKRYERRRQIARYRRELHALSDRDLRDIGLTRGDISRIARGGSR